jgi:transposase-like protein
MRGRKVPDDMQARVMAALLVGAGVVEIARELGLPHQTVSDIKNTIPEDKLGEIRRKKGERIDDLVYDYLVQNLETLRAQAKAVSNESYIQKQPAGELATLHGVMADKTVRLLEVTTGRGPIGELSAAPAGST